MPKRNPLDPDEPSLTLADKPKVLRRSALPRALQAVLPAPGSGRGPQKSPTKVPVTIRLERDVVDAYKATGPGWQSRISEALVKASRKLRQAS